MKAAFIHDHNFVFDKESGDFYDGSGGAFDPLLWSRYLDVFDSLKVVCREIDGLPNQLVLSSTKNVEFDLIKENTGGIKRFTNARKIKKLIGEKLRNVDFAIIRLPSSLGYFAQELCEENQVPYVIEVVGCPWDAYWNYGSVKAKLVAPIEYLRLKRATAKSQFAVYVTAQFLQRRYPAGGESIGISNVRIEKIAESSSVTEFYAKSRVLLNNNQTFNVGMIGSFHVKYKGHIELIKALDYIISRRLIPNIIFHFVGTGDSKWVNDLSASYGISNHVKILGTLEAGENGVLPFLDSMHLYAHPSKQEGLPRVVIEAMSRGRISLGSTTAGIPELLNNKYLHRPGDWKSLADDIIYIYNNKNSWIDIANANLLTASNYLEYNLQNKRSNFLRMAANIKHSNE